MKCCVQNGVISTSFNEANTPSWVYTHFIPLDDSVISTDPSIVSLDTSNNEVLALSLSTSTDHNLEERKLKEHFFHYPLLTVSRTAPGIICFQNPPVSQESMPEDRHALLTELIKDTLWEAAIGGGDLEDASEVVLAESDNQYHSYNVKALTMMSQATMELMAFTRSMWPEWLAWFRDNPGSPLSVASHAKIEAKELLEPSA